MVTRWETTPAANPLKPADFIYLTDGPRQGETVLAAAHTGKIVLAPVPNGVPRIGSELVYEPTKLKTSEGARCFRLVVPGRFETQEGGGMSEQRQGGDAPRGTTHRAALGAGGER